MIDHRRIESFSKEQADCVKLPDGAIMLILSGIEECEGLREGDDWDLSAGILPPVGRFSSGLFGLHIKLRPAGKRRWRQIALYFDWIQWQPIIERLIASSEPMLMLTKSEDISTPTAAKAEGYSVIALVRDDWRQLAAMLNTGSVADIESDYRRSPRYRKQAP